MVDELKAQVIRVYENPLLLPTGGIERRMRVDYMVGTHGPFAVTLPTSDFSAARAQQEIDKTVAEIRKLAAPR